MKQNSDSPAAEAAPAAPSPEGSLKRSRGASPEPSRGASAEPDRGPECSVPLAPGTVDADPDAALSDGAPPAAIPMIPFDPVPVRPRRDGWTAARQRIFIQELAATGSARRAARRAGMSERSAHRLALRPDAGSLCLAWDAALQIAARRGASILFEYALEGVVETVWRDGEVVYRRRRPSEKALFFLLSRLDPLRFGRPDPDAPDFDPISANLADLDLHLDGLTDLPDQEQEDGRDADAA
jgi:hypothetical protein